MMINGIQRETLRNGITFAYNSKDKLEMFLSEQMEINVEKKARGNCYETIVFYLIQDFEAEGKLEEFIIQLITKNELKEFRISLLDIFLSPIKLEIIQEAYQQSRPEDAHLWYLKANSREEMLQELYECRQLNTFLDYLIKCKEVSPEIQNSLKNLAEKLTHVNQDRQTLQQTLDNKPKKFEAYLLILIEHSENSKPFLVKSWLIENDSDGDEPTGLDLLPFYSAKIDKYQPLVDRDNNCQGIPCKYEEIETIIDQLIQKTHSKLIWKNYTLQIEFFLPCDLLCQQVEWWSMTDGEDKIRIGTKYPVRIRSSERLNPRYLNSTSFPQWRNNWNRVRQMFKDKIIGEILEPHQDMNFLNWECLEKKFLDFQQKVGIRLTCDSSEVRIRDLFKAIWKSAIPIVVWTRLNPLSTLYQEIVMDNLLNEQKLWDLCEYVKKMRYQAYNPATKSPNQHHLGSHLTILWENPYRLTPDSLIPLIPPGQ